ncbi:MAG: hypothetical protein MRZ94_03845 [Oscillospiraceae bacterium]|nr:hypothetical protein [Oscillospiraceae bacterium]MDD7293944.1 hypothetical protein [Oscillospiraceae bacterium]MDY2510075.1 hypothetical protein [Ruminococcus callidus]
MPLTVYEMETAARHRRTAKRFRRRRFNKVSLRNGEIDLHDILPSIANNTVVCNAANSGCKAIGFAKAV